MRTVRLLVALLVLASFSALPAADAARDTTQVNYYEHPCHRDVREARGIPAGSALIRWELQHAYSEVAAEYHAALRACPPIVHFDFDNMVVVAIEHI